MHYSSATHAIFFNVGYRYPQDENVLSLHIVGALPFLSRFLPGSYITHGKH